MCEIVPMQDATQPQNRSEVHGLSRFTPPILQQLHPGGHRILILISSIYCAIPIPFPGVEFPKRYRNVPLIYVLTVRTTASKQATLATIYDLMIYSWDLQYASKRGFYFGFWGLRKWVGGRWWCLMELVAIVLGLFLAHLENLFLALP